MALRMNYRIVSSVFGCAIRMANGPSRALQTRRSLISAIGIGIGSMNIFMGTLAPASVHLIKRAGPASLRNLFINKVSTAQLESPIRSGIYETPSTEFSLQIFGGSFYKLARWLRTIVLSRAKSRALGSKL